jgi:hypothetical protein
MGGPYSPREVRESSVEHARATSSSVGITCAHVESVTTGDECPSQPATASGVRVMPSARGEDAPVGFDDAH